MNILPSVRYPLILSFITLFCLMFTANAVNAQEICYDEDYTKLCSDNRIVFPNETVTIEGIAQTNYRRFLWLRWIQIEGSDVALGSTAVYNNSGDYVNNKLAKIIYTVPNSPGAELKFELKVRLGVAGGFDKNKSIQVTHRIAPASSLINGGDEVSLDLPENTRIVRVITTTEPSVFTIIDTYHDGILFEITENGTLLFKTQYIPNYEQPRNALGIIDESLDQVYWVRVKAVGNSNNEVDSQIVKINITNAN